VLRLVTLNLNGIRSAATKGFEAWAAASAPDCMGVQEVKAQADTVDGRFDRVAGMTGHFHYAQKKGYSGPASTTTAVRSFRASVSSAAISRAAAAERSGSRPSSVFSH
jgi:exonuclease III